ncbi:ROK family protein [Nonomuraea angiospora]|uniref:ROK family protein n=1 Tax=Nonomuraea angiospora TaxID=46172 RepID=UPI0029A26031|nr:ROK family protein [Nonomuraea angiospora]MDX3103271.1 ROK family protein [Nonomuraea angiospora]
MTRPDGGVPLALAVDIGRTKIAAGLVAADGTLAEHRRTATPTGPEILGTVFELARPLMERAAVCGIGTASTVDPQGRIASATDLLTGWAGTDAKGAAERTLALPTVVLNDCHAAGAAGARAGAARDARTALVVAVGTGIGGAVCVEGRVRTGVSGTAGSIGHLPVLSRQRRRADRRRVRHCVVRRRRLAGPQHRRRLFDHRGPRRAEDRQGAA